MPPSQPNPTNTHKNKKKPPDKPHT
jgi:hypothetical protein